MIRLSSPAVLALFVLSACQDPIVGVWESEQAISFEGLSLGTIELEIEKDLRGEGSTSDIACTFDIEVSAQGDDEYEIEAELGGCGLLDTEYDCELDDDELECDLEGLIVDFERD